MSRTCVWIHDAALSPEDVALRTHPDAAVVFVFDEPSLREEPLAFHRLRFVFDGVCELFETITHPIKEVRLGNTFDEIRDFCQLHGCSELALTDHANPFVRQIAGQLEREMPVHVYPRSQLALYPEEPRRFSRYWNKVAREVLGYTPNSSKRFHK